MKAYNLDHVGIAVNDLDAAVAGYRRRYNIDVMHREVVAEQGVEEAMLALGGSFVQLIAPLS
ncbi:MAG TPA: VOC family protein, partial [Acidimicrobiia bacterium]|nr:VOC family protein [Acidimicrobiia bacterium]